MKNKRRKIGARGTKDNKHTVRDKRISNRSTGNKGHNRSSINRDKDINVESNNRLLNKLSPKGKANLLKIQEVVRENSKFVIIFIGSCHQILFLLVVAINRYKYHYCNEFIC